MFFGIFANIGNMFAMNMTSDFGFFFLKDFMEGRLKFFSGFNRAFNLNEGKKGRNKW